MKTARQYAEEALGDWTANPALKEAILDVAGRAAQAVIDDADEELAWKKLTQLEPEGEDNG